MSTRTKATLLTIALAGAAFFLSPVIWPVSPDFPEPTSTQLPFFAALAVAEALLFGLGISLLVFGGRLARRTSRPARATVALVCIAWLLASWWPHIGFHLHSGFDMQALLLIDYGFHLTLMAAGVILAYLFVTDVRAGKAVTASAASVDQPLRDRAEATAARSR
jgi:hypothetical protein